MSIKIFCDSCNDEIFDYDTNYINVELKGNDTISIKRIEECKIIHFCDECMSKLKNKKSLIDFFFKRRF